MRICVFFESRLVPERSSGMRTAFRNHLKALKQAGIQATTTPKSKFDILHLHSLGPLSILLMEQNLGKRPVVVHAHSTAQDFANSFALSDTISPLWGQYLRYFYKRADLVIAPSAYTRRVLHQEGVNIPIEVVSNGVDVDYFSEVTIHKEREKRRLGLHGPVVFSVGLVLMRKGIDLFCETARRLPKVEFVWFGPIYRVLKVETSLVMKNAPSNVRFYGHLKDIRSAYAAGDIFFFPSRVENEGIAVLEAAASRHPLVLRDAECFRDRFRPGTDALLASTPEECAAHLKEVLANRTLAGRLSRRAYKIAEAHSLEKIGSRYREIYRSLLSKSTTMIRVDRM